MKLMFAILYYAACFLILFVTYDTPEWWALSHGWPKTDREIVVALMVGVALASKLMGHVFLFAWGTSRNARA